MPNNVVKTKADEKKWEKARSIAEKAGHKDEWAYIMGVYKKMKPDHFKSAEETQHTMPGEVGADTRDEAADEMLAGTRDEIEKDKIPELAKARARENLDKDEEFYKNKKKKELSKHLAAKYLQRKWAWEDHMPGGLADKKKPGDFDPKQIEMGIKVEMEHTNDRAQAEEIAMDHLSEIPDYYTRLKGMEDEADGARMASRYLKANPHVHAELLLADLLGVLKALHWQHWTTHWQSNGSNYYGDHLLFERLYEAVQDEIDTLAEKMVAYFGEGVVNNTDSAERMQSYLSKWSSIEDPIERSKAAEEEFQVRLKRTRDEMDKAGVLTLGLDDYLAATANTHETHLYLLGQRSKTGPVKAKTASILWEPQGEQESMSDPKNPAEAIAYRYAARAKRWKVALFSDNPGAKPLWTQEFTAVEGREQERALTLVRPHLDRFANAEDWVVEEVPGKRGSVSVGPEDLPPIGAQVTGYSQDPTDAEAIERSLGAIDMHFDTGGWVPVHVHAEESSSKKAAGDWLKDISRSRRARSNAKVVEIPSAFFPVELKKPEVTRKDNPFEGFIDFQGIQIDVENAKGSTRKGKGPEGEWEIFMFSHYGEIRGTEGVDGDKLDVYVGDNHDSPLIVVIHQHNPWDGKYDEDKVMLGFESVEEAIGAYKKQYDRPGFYRDGEHIAMPIGQFWRWITDTRKKGKKVTGAQKVAWTVMVRMAMGRSGREELDEDDPATSNNGAPSGLYLEFLEDTKGQRVVNPDSQRQVKIKSLNGPRGKKLRYKLFQDWLKKRDPDKDEELEEKAEKSEEESTKTTSKGHTIKVEYDKKFRDLFVQKMFGKDVPDEELIKLAGVEAFDDVTVTLSEKSNGLGLTVEGPHIKYMERVLDYDYDSGEYIISNEAVALEDDAPPGTGTRMFGKAVEQARKLGVKKIECYADRSDGIGMVGYYVWPRLGYDGKFPDKLIPKLQESIDKGELPSSYAMIPEIGGVRSLMYTPEGREWWKKNGRGFLASFDPQGKSYDILKSYMDAKNMKMAKKERGDNSIDDSELDDKTLDKLWDKRKSEWDELVKEHKNKGKKEAVRSWVRTLSTDELAREVGSLTQARAMKTAAFKVAAEETFKPPAAVSDAAEKGLKYRQKASPSNKGGLTSEEAGRQGIGSGVQRAVNLKNRDNLTADTVRQMHRFFNRHEKNKSIAPEHKGEPWNDKGYVSWLLWGGDAGKTWAQGIVDKLDKTEKKAAAKKPSTKVWFHGTRGNFTGPVRPLYLTPSSALAELHGESYSFEMKSSAKWYDMANMPETGPNVWSSMDSIGYNKAEADKIRKAGYDVVWDSADYRGHEQVYVVNPRVLTPVTAKRATGLFDDVFKGLGGAGDPEQEALLKVERMVGGRAPMRDAREILSSPKAIQLVNGRYYFWIRQGAWYVYIDAPKSELKHHVAEVIRGLIPPAKLPSLEPVVHVVHDKVMYVGSNDGKVTKFPPVIARGWDSRKAASINDYHRACARAWTKLRIYPPAHMDGLSALWAELYKGTPPDDLAFEYETYFGGKAEAKKLLQACRDLDGNRMLPPQGSTVRLFHSVLNSPESTVPKILAQGMKAQAQGVGKYSEDPNAIFFVEGSPGKRYSDRGVWLCVDIPLKWDGWEGAIGVDYDWKTEKVIRPPTPGAVVAIYRPIPAKFITAVNGLPVAEYKKRPKLKEPVVNTDTNEEA